MGNSEYWTLLGITAVLAFWNVGLYFLSRMLGGEVRDLQSRVRKLEGAVRGDAPEDPPVSTGPPPKEP